MMKKKGKSKNKKGFFRDNYSQSWEYIKESKNFIWAVVIIFFVAAIAGFLIHPPAVVSFILDYIKDVLAKTEGMSSFELIQYIFLNNIQLGFVGILYGFLLGIPPILYSLANGYVVGYVSSSAVSSSGASSLLNLLPHGIFELPAIFISWGMGIKFGTFIFYKEKIKHFGEFFVNSLRVFIFVILPLLVIAAIIEGILISLL
jgi:stage II sporulation protein M